MHHHTIAHVSRSQTPPAPRVSKARAGSGRCLHAMSCSVTEAGSRLCCCRSKRSKSGGGRKAAGSTLRGQTPTASSDSPTLYSGAAKSTITAADCFCICSASKSATATPNNARATCVPPYPLPGDKPPQVNRIPDSWILLSHAHWATHRHPRRSSHTGNPPGRPVCSNRWPARYL